MDLTASGAISVPATKSGARGLAAASFVLAGTLLSLTGLTWDIQWHDDVGPDTFFTLPHLFLYSGSAVAGIASLIVVLRTTAATRKGKQVDPMVGGRAVGVFGRTFAAPVGYLVSGTGAAMFLLYGLWDQWWHSLYGFDAVISSPPHIGLLLSITVTMVGAVMVFAVARGERWGKFGTIGSLAVLTGFSMVTVIGLSEIDAGIVNTVVVGTAFFSVLTVIMGAEVIGRPGGALGVALSLAAIQAVFWWFSPWAAETYASMVGLPLRDNVDNVPDMPAMMPMSLILVAVAVELVRRFGTGRALAALGGTIGGLIVTGLQPVQRAWIYGAHLPPASSMIATIVAGGVFGALSGFLGWRFGVMLRQLAPAKENSDA
ncbi:hypothetical protein SAMN05421504_11725 [Amycolatopsis xylanica]|uniref:Uncharacterized protein n=1 Tax=Amycolatopsis xylanica TaxID=589385 RepID=A0A1H3T1Z7_9PSEU|nr:hypothetical protein [Amycolatopsis xylanica]SDZ44262.1 hypothetical protein SAMN05421504_11725 [Amycolatopsis xylanica]